MSSAVTLRTRRHGLPSVLTFAGFLLLVGCATVAPSQVSEAREDGRVFTSLPTDFAPVRVSEVDFASALAGLVVEMPLRVAPSRFPLQPRRLLALAPRPGEGETGQSELARSYGRFCERRGTPGDCLTLFEDDSLLDEGDKRRIALALAVGPALEGVDAEVRTLLSPARLLATVSITISGYMALLVVPEPVSKGVAAALGLLLWGYLGWEFWDLMEGWMRLSEESGRATTFAELRAAGERFGRRIGPNSVRILVMLGTAAVGETAALMSRASRLPGFAQASRTTELHGGVRLIDAATGAERLVLSVPEGSLRVVLPANALAMASGGPSTPSTGKVGRVLPNGHRAFNSFDDFKDALGAAGEGKEWHHIVEQRQANLTRFGPEALHNTENVIRLDANIHRQISAWYSTKPQGWNQTIRQWLGEQSFEAQRQYGLKTLRRFGVAL